MLTNIHIENYKSVADLNLELGRLNVFIGANGCGKSNILEAIALGSAASKNQLEDIFLSTRGIRVTDADMMKSAFEKEGKERDIVVEFGEGEYKVIYLFDFDKENGRWTRHLDDNSTLKKIISELDLENRRKVFRKMHAEFGSATIEEKEVLVNNEDFNRTLSSMRKDTDLLVNKMNDFQNSTDFENFLIYSPENYFLRNNNDDSHIKPLGIRGEGLLRHLKEIYTKDYTKFQEIKQGLDLIDWFSDIELESHPVFKDTSMNIRDRFLHEDAQIFDQRSANEGFLYLLFYFTLFISDKTPKFFAIDNIDNAMNPKLCARLIEVLAELAEKHGKQVILTTHNPAILDGLNLNDDAQRLFVVSRNRKGHTKATRLPALKTVEGQVPPRLSELFLDGVIGGLSEF